MQIDKRAAFVTRFIMYKRLQSAERYIESYNFFYTWPTTHFYTYGITFAVPGIPSVVTVCVSPVPSMRSSTLRLRSRIKP